MLCKLPVPQTVSFGSIVGKVCLAVSCTLVSRIQETIPNSTAHIQPFVCCFVPEFVSAVHFLFELNTVRIGPKVQQPRFPVPVDGYQGHQMAMPAVLIVAAQINMDTSQLSLRCGDSTHEIRVCDPSITICHA